MEIDGHDELTGEEIDRADIKFIEQADLEDFDDEYYDEVTGEEIDEADILQTDAHIGAEYWDGRL